jgi:hypothetical protein
MAGAQNRGPLDRGAQSRGTRSTRPRGLGIGVAIFVAVTALAVVGCSDLITWATPDASGAAQTRPAQPTKANVATSYWPSCGKVRQALQGKGYAFAHKGTLWQVIKGGALAISISDKDDSAPGVSVSLYNASYEKYRTDIDYVFSAIAPEAKSWAHDQMNQTKTVKSFATTMATSGGTITMSWDKSQATLVFNFAGNPLP